MNTYKATSFSTRQDIARYAECVYNGGDKDECLNVGDNGIGEWNDPMWNPAGTPWVALPKGIGIHNKQLKVILAVGHGQPFICVCGDISPAGVIDLTPAALIAAGLDPDYELLSTAQWDWV